MTVYVLKEGHLVEKPEARSPAPTSGFPTPFVSRIEPYESPIDGHEITSWGEREREMKANDAYDPRDLPRDHKFTNRTRRDATQQPDASVIGEWRDPQQVVPRDR